MQDIQEFFDEVLNCREQYQDVKYPIYIPSKGRAGKAKTMSILEEAGLNPTVFVEPQEEAEYRNHYKNVVVLPKSNQGITYVRNFIKQYSIEQGDAWHWQADDNIQSFRIRLNNKNVRYSCRSVLAMAEYLTDQHSNIGIAGLIHTAFAFSKKVNVGINKQTYSCVLVNNSVPIKWNSGLPEDTDYSLQVLSKGLCTVNYNRLLIEKEISKEGNGGNDNSHEWRLARAKKLQETWPIANFRYIHQYGRVKILPSRIWVQFPQRPKRIGQKNFIDQFLTG